MEQVYRGALQAKDATADVVKTELETLGPLKLAPAAADAHPPARQLLRAMIGIWQVKHIGEHRAKWEFREDGTCAITPGTSQIPDSFCTWAKNKAKIDVWAENGDITALELPVKAGKLEGTDKNGRRLWLEKAK